MLPWLRALAILAIGAWFLSYFAGKAAFYPSKYPEGWWDQQAVLGAQDVFIDTEDGVRLHSWWIERNKSEPDGTDNGERDAADLVTLFLHGNAGNVTHRAQHAQQILAAGSSVLLLDYRGYGKSEGSPSEEGLYTDALAAYEYLRGQGVTPERLIIHGESLGTAAAVDLASKKPAAGLVLESGFSSGRAVAQSVLPVLGPLLFGGYNSVSKISQVKMPLLQFHGDRDRIVDISLGRALFEAAGQPKQFVTIPGGDHNDLIPSAGDLYRKSLQAFYQRLELR